MNKGLLIPDSHIPYEDSRAFNLMLKVGRALKPRSVIIGGDFGDCYAISRFRKDSQRKLGFKDEVAAVKKRLRQVETLRAKNLVYLLGNHEERMPKYIADNAPELADLVTIKDLYELDRWEVVPYAEDYELGGHFFAHDYDRAGQYAIDSTYRDVQDNVAFFHTHRLGKKWFVSARGIVHQATNLGWLGDYRYIDYKKKRKAIRTSQLGFGIFYDTGTRIQVDPIAIYEDYTCIVEGKLYRG